MLRICLVVYEEHCFQQAHQQMLADGLLLPLPILCQAAQQTMISNQSQFQGSPSQRSSWKTGTNACDVF
jgi:hypothetical protein